MKLMFLKSFKKILILETMKQRSIQHDLTNYDLNN